MGGGDRRGFRRGALRRDDGPEVGLVIPDDRVDCLEYGELHDGGEARLREGGWAAIVACMIAFQSRMTSALPAAGIISSAITLQYGFHNCLFLIILTCAFRKVCRERVRLTCRSSSRLRARTAHLYVQAGINSQNCKPPQKNA